MEVTVSDAKAQLTDLVRRAEQGEDVVLTRYGQVVAQIVPVRRARPRRTREEFLAAIRSIQEQAKETMLLGPDAAHSADFLYDDETGLPK